MIFHFIYLSFDSRGISNLQRLTGMLLKRHNSQNVRTGIKAIWSGYAWNWLPIDEFIARIQARASLTFSAS